MKSHKPAPTAAEMREIQPSCLAQPSCASSQSAPLSISPQAGLAAHCQLLYPPGFNMKPHREKPSASGPRNLRDEAALGTASGESLQETIDGQRKGKEKKKKREMY